MKNIVFALMIGLICLSLIPSYKYLTSESERLNQGLTMYREYRTYDQAPIYVRMPDKTATVPMAIIFLQTTAIFCLACILLNENLSKGGEPL